MNTRVTALTTLIAPAHSQRRLVRPRITLSTLTLFTHSPYPHAAARPPGQIRTHSHSRLPNNSPTSPLNTNQPLCAPSTFSGGGFMKIGLQAAPASSCRHCHRADRALLKGLWWRRTRRPPAPGSMRRRHSFGSRTVAAPRTPLWKRRRRAHRLTPAGSRPERARARSRIQRAHPTAPYAPRSGTRSALRSISGRTDSGAAAAFGAGAGRACGAFTFTSEGATDGSRRLGLRGVAA